jgi:hypothetical protein
VTIRIYIDKEKRRITIKKNSRFSDEFPTATLTPPKQHQKSSFFKNDASKKNSA